MALQFLQGLYKKKQGKEEESYCKARVSRSENEIASYWYHNVLLGMSLNLVMGSKAIKEDFLKSFRLLNSRTNYYVLNHSKEKNNGVAYRGF